MEPLSDFRAPQGVERRAAVELRASARRNSPPKLEGYAIIWGARSLNLGGFVETIEGGAFTELLADPAIDPVALAGHDGNALLGRRSAKTLDLNEDERGLSFVIDLPDTQAARDVATSVQRGDLKHMSFGFGVEGSGGDVWHIPKTGPAERTVKRAKLWEISTSAIAAYGQTEVALRSLQAARAAQPVDVADPRQIEERLRLAGFSKAEARKIVPGALRALGIDDGRDDVEAAARFARSLKLLTSKLKG